MTVYCTEYPRSFIVSRKPFSASVSPRQGTRAFLSSWAGAMGANPATTATSDSSPALRSRLFINPLPPQPSLERCRVHPIAAEDVLDDALLVQRSEHVVE